MLKETMFLLSLVGVRCDNAGPWATEFCLKLPLVNDDSNCDAFLGFGLGTCKEGYRANTATWFFSSCEEKHSDDHDHTTVTGVARDHIHIGPGFNHDFISPSPPPPASPLKPPSPPPHPLPPPSLPPSPPPPLPPPSPPPPSPPPPSPPP